MTDIEKNTLIEIERRSMLNERAISEIQSDIKDIQEDNKALHKLATSVELIAQDMCNVKNIINDVKDDMTEVKGKMVDIEHAPAKKKAEDMNKIKVAVITALATASAIGLFEALVFFGGK